MHTRNSWNRPGAEKFGMNYILLDSFWDLDDDCFRMDQKRFHKGVVSPVPPIWVLFSLP